MALPVPQHVAVIMDGNGRWAEARGHARTAGHVRGARRAKEIVRVADKMGIKYLTLFGFSSENWNRPKIEVSLLMKLLSKYLKSESKELLKKNVRVRVFGDRAGFPPQIIKHLSDLVEKSQKNTGLQLNFAFNYGGRQEILHAIQEIARRVKAGDLQPTEISEALLTRFLYSAEVPDPDLIIRTSGEHRVSNFLLWQGAYSEFYFTPVLWPDFDSRELELAVREYRNRGRRFGGIANLTESPASQVSEVRVAP
jgi:undecaprenyl diphosphate synthase